MGLFGFMGKVAVGAAKLAEKGANLAEKGIKLAEKGVKMAGSINKESKNKENDFKKEKKDKTKDIEVVEKDREESITETSAKDIKSQVVLVENKQVQSKQTISYEEQIHALKELNELLKEGIITQQEFDLKKKEILGL